MALPTLNLKSRSLRRPRSPRNAFKSAGVILLAGVLLVAFLLPLVYMLFTSLKTKEQMSQLGTPLWPADAPTFTYNGVEYDVYRVPTDQEAKDLALVKKGLTESYFIDPANPQAGQIKWTGSWRSLPRSTWTFAPHWENFITAWNQINFPRMFGNTLFYAIMTEIGVLISCTLVAYGFARFRFPGRDFLWNLHRSGRDLRECWANDRYGRGI